MLDDDSRFIIYQKLRESRNVEDVQRTVVQVIEKVALGKLQRLKLLPDVGSCYIASQFKTYMDEKQIKRIHGRLLPPQTKGKIERYHWSMKNVLLLDHYYYLKELIAALDQFVHHHSQERYHKTLENVTPADVHFGRNEQVLKQKAKIKQQTLLKRRSLYRIEQLINT